MYTKGMLPQGPFTSPHQYWRTFLEELVLCSLDQKAMISSWPTATDFWPQGWCVYATTALCGDCNTDPTFSAKLALHDSLTTLNQQEAYVHVGTYSPLNSPSSDISASLTIFSTALRSALEQWGGRLYPRMERPVRTRDDSTQFESRLSPPFRLAGFKSVLCLASWS